MTELRTVPLEGIPEVLDSPAGIRQAAALLDGGHGPVAIDTERASAYRYDDRAFLLQLRRADTDTLLIDPEGQRDEVRDILGPSINGLDWVLHAAPSDLPALAGVGLYPGRLFDTELASRLAGFAHPNLGAMVHELLGVDLEKGYGDADWSTRPLPKEWLAYAALDVELLLELAETLRDILAETEKYDWALQEFDAIVEKYATVTGPPQQTWRELKGVNTLHRSEQLAVARALWTARDNLAISKDRAPGKILPNKVLVNIARQVPHSRSELEQVKGFPRRRRGAASSWMRVINRARQQPRSQWPRPQRTASKVPSKTTWVKDHPDEWEVYQGVRADIAELSEHLSINADTIMKPATVRAAVWSVIGTPASRDHANGTRSFGGSVRQVDDLPRVLANEGARPWQIELVMPILARRLFAERSES